MPPIVKIESATAPTEKLTKRQLQQRVVKWAQIGEKFNGMNRQGTGRNALRSNRMNSERTKRKCADDRGLSPTDTPLKAGKQAQLD